MKNRTAMVVAKRLGSDAAPEPKSVFSTPMQRLLYSTWTCASCPVQAPLEVATFQSSHAGPVGVRTSAAALYNGWFCSSCSPLAEVPPEAGLCHEHLHRQHVRDIPRQIVTASLVLCIISCPSCGKPRLFEHVSCRAGSLSIETAIRRHFDTKAGW